MPGTGGGIPGTGGGIPGTGGGTPGTGGGGGGTETSGENIGIGEMASCDGSVCASNVGDSTLSSSVCSAGESDPEW